MGKQERRTEHAGPKKGRGAFYGPKKIAKRKSKVRRRLNDQREADRQERERHSQEP